MVTKSYVPFLSSMYRNILSDVSNLDPAFPKECERDLKRLLSLLETRGHHFAMVDLPAFGKHFDRCLSNGHLTKSSVSGFRPFRRRGVIPRLFKGLLLRVFQENGLLKVDYDILAIRSIRQLCRVFKRFRISCSSDVIEEHVREFIKIDDDCLPSSLNWDDPDFDVTLASSLHLGEIRQRNTDDGTANIIPARELRHIGHVLQRVSDIVAVSFGSFEPRDWAFKHGPGAVASDSIVPNYKYSFGHWSKRLERVFPMADFAFANYSQWVDGHQGWDQSDDDPSSKLIAVPKTLDAPRLIASEPIEHQWCQQSILNFLMKRVTSTWLGSAISFNDQTLNQIAALRSSHTGSHATIDLSSASDRVSCWLVERVFRRNSSLLSALQACRTNQIRLIPYSGLPKVLHLKKFSTMGSAGIFPIQSITFLCLSLAAICYSRKIEPTQKVLSQLVKEVRVFGDDLIVPKDCWTELVGYLHLYGLKVNPNKTFGTGKFRESCGLEGYDGHDVSCSYILGEPTYKRPESVISAVDSIKNLCNKGYIIGASALMRTIPKRYKFASVSLDSGAFGLPDFLHPYSPRKRMSKDTQTRQILVHTPSVKTEYIRAEGGPAILQYFTEACKAKFVQGERIGRSLRPKNSLVLRWVEAG
jgi:hypothetical protein